MYKTVCISLVFRKSGLDSRLLKYFTLLMCLKDSDDKAKETPKENSEDMDKNHDCPLCLETLDLDDKKFYPCTCGYQVCRFCWHRIKSQENGLCPACRRVYPENPANFEPLTPEETAKLKLKKKMKDMQKKQKIAENKKQLSNTRVIQKNLVFSVGLPLELSQDTEKKEKVLNMFRQFGPTQKETITDRTNYAGAQGPSACVYITFQRSEDAVRAVKSLTNTKVDGRTIKVSLGTTKYCSNFLKGIHCPKAECLYLHELADEEASFTKEDIHLGKHLEYEMKLLEQTSNSSSYNKLPSPSNESNCVNHNHNIDESSESSDDVHQNDSCDNSDMLELSPSNNQTLQNIRNIGSDVSNVTENNHQSILSSNPELRTTPELPKPFIQIEENCFERQKFLDRLHFSNHMQQKETEFLKQPLFLNNQIFETASKGQSNCKESSLLKIISPEMIEGQNKQVPEVLNTKHESADTRPNKRDDDPDLEFDPLGVALSGLEELVISETKEKKRKYYNSINRSPLSNKSPLSSVQSLDYSEFRNSPLCIAKVRDPPPGFTSNCTQSIHYKPPYETTPPSVKSPLPLHFGRTNSSILPHQRYAQPGSSVNNSFFPEYTSSFPPECIISPAMQQHSQRVMNVSQVQQYPMPELHRPPVSWNNTSQSQWRPMENMFYNQSVAENRATSDFNLRMPMRSNDATIRQWQQFPSNVNNVSLYQDHPPTIPEQVAKVQVFKAVEAAQRNSPSFGHRLQYTKKL